MQQQLCYDAAAALLSSHERIICRTARPCDELATGCDCHGRNHKCVNQRAAMGVRVCLEVHTRFMAVMYRAGAAAIRLQD